MYGFKGIQVEVITNIATQRPTYPFKTQQVKTLNFHAMVSFEILTS